MNQKVQILVNNPDTQIHSADRLKDFQTLLNWRQPVLMKDNYVHGSNIRY